MRVPESDIPRSITLSPDLIDNAHFHDCYRAPLRRPELAMVDIFLGLFAHRPLWMKLLLVIRNAAARLAGLEAPSVAEIMQPSSSETYHVGEKIGPWPIFFMSDTEIVAGRDNKHMDFRLSVLKAVNGEGASVTVSTICTVHN